MKKKARIKVAETDLYQPVREFFEDRGYTVNSEVHRCDITATKEDELVVIELKLHFNIQLLYQATERQRIADKVYMAVPRPNKGKWAPNWDKMCHLARRLELGLMIVHFQTEKPFAELIFEPLPFEMKRQHKKRSALLKEVEGRSMEYNKGGSVKQKLMTAYRDNAVQIAVCLRKYGILSPKALKGLGTGDKTPNILSNNFYGWFERVKTGRYTITAQGLEALEKYRELAEIYERLLES